MPSLKDVQNQIAGVKKTKQITRAMNMVASAKLRGAQQRIERFGPYAEKFHDMLSELGAGADDSAHPLLARREEVTTVGLLVMTSDRGLCGSFNASILSRAKKLAASLAEDGKTVKLICVGKKARDAFKKLPYETVGVYADELGNFDFDLANRIGMQIIDAFLREQMDEVHMLFGHFINVARQEPQTIQVLPVVSTAAEDASAPVSTAEYTYEPSVEGLLAELLPRYVKVSVYRGLLDTSASEHAARMTAMDNATRNCNDMIKDLTLKFNKARQAAITMELIDIVSGAEALKG